jgi:hypothetical protein
MFAFISILLCMYVLHLRKGRAGNEALPCKQRYKIHLSALQKLELMRDKHHSFAAGLAPTESVTPHGSTGVRIQS